MRLFTSSVFALALGLAASGFAVAADPIAAARPDDPRGAGYAFQVVQGGRLAQSRATGSASIELGVPLQPASVFRIGSVTKPIVAAAILRMQELGRISLDDPLVRFLPDYPGAQKITVRQLLAHTAGVSDAWENDPAKQVTTGEVVALIGRQPLDFAPGMQWRYSNSGYMLVGAVIEAIEKRPWCDVVRSLVLEPAGMFHSGCFGDREIVPGVANGYSYAADGSLKRAPYINMSGPGAAGSMYSSAPDLQLFVRALVGGTLLKPASLEAMTSQQRTTDGAETGYGLGLRITTVHGLPAWEHDGGIDGFASQLTVLPADDVAVVVLANSDNAVEAPRSIAHRLAAAAAGRPYPHFTDAPCPKACVDIAGRYGEGATVRNIVFEGGRIYSERPGGPRRLLYYAQGDRLVFVGDGTDYFQIVRNRSGAPVAIDFHSDAAENGRRDARR